MANVLGIDVSIWQGYMDFAKAYTAGARFAFLRAGSCTEVEGTLYADNQFQRNSSIAPTYMPTGAYWYFRPNHSPTAQADYFWNLVKDKALRLPLVMDVETHGGLDKSTVAMRCGQFATRLREHSGKWPMVYTRASFWNPFVGDPAWAKNCELWIARYSSALTGPWSDGMYQPTSWDDWDWWQWIADGNNRGAEFGASSPHIDLDYFNGDIAAFRAYLGQRENDPGPIPEPAPKPTLEERVEALEKAVFG